MKKFTPLFFIIIILVSACKKEKAPVTIPVEFTSTNYQTLGTYDSFGKPNYLLAPDIISANMQSLINSTLIEKSDLRIAHPELLQLMQLLILL